MSRLIFDASTLGGTTTLSSEDAVGNFTIDVPAVTGTMLIPATVGLANQVLTSNATAAPTWAYLAGTGTVTSVDGSGGTTGLTLTGGPITASGTLTLGGTLAIANGGTGATTDSAARTALGLGTMAVQAASAVAITGGSINGTSIGATTAGSAKVTTLDIASGLTLATLAGTSGQVLTSAGASVVPTWTTPTTGTVTSVAGTGTVNGLTLTGTVTSSGSLTLGGTLSLVSPPPIGTTTPAEVKVTVGWAANTALTDAATVAWDTTNQVATFTFVSSNRTMGAPTNLKDGAFYALAVIQNAGSNTLTWASNFKWAAGTAPTLSTAAGARDYFVWRSDGTNLYQQGISQAVA